MLVDAFKWLKRAVGIDKADLPSVPTLDQQLNMIAREHKLSQAEVDRVAANLQEHPHQLRYWAERGEDNNSPLRKIALAIESAGSAVKRDET